MSEILDLRKAFDTKTIIESICDWNAARYDQVLSTNLTVDLLSEEDRETALAVANNDLVEICDGLADIFYVAVGGMWKHGLNHEEITEVLDWASQRLLPPVRASIVWYSIEPAPAVLALIALRAFERLAAGLNSDDYALDVIRAVCVSNDTKPAKKTDSSVKANIDKGAKYIAPTEAIKKIIKLSAVTGGTNVS